MFKIKEPYALWKLRYKTKYPVIALEKSEQSLRTVWENIPWFSI